MELDSRRLSKELFSMKSSNPPNREKQKELETAKKARMLITILGPDFTRKSSHPFFRNLSETASKPILTDDASTDISGALQNLMTRLSRHQSKTAQSQEHLETKTHNRKEIELSVARLRTEGFVIENNQHPAMLAKELLSKPSTERTRIIKTLSRPVARRVVIYMRELDQPTS